MPDAIGILSDDLRIRGWEVHDSEPSSTGGYQITGLHSDSQGEFSLRIGPQAFVCELNPHAPEKVCVPAREDALVVTLSR